MNIKEERTKLGLTQLEISIKLGITREWFAHVELDYRKASLPLLLKMGTLFKLEKKDIVEEYLGRKENE